MKRCRFVFCGDETTSFQPPSNAYQRNLFLISKIPNFDLLAFAICTEGGRGRGRGRVGPGGWGVGSNLVPASSDSDQRQRSEIELLEATWRRRRRGPAVRLLTATEVQPSKRKSQILDQRLEARDLEKLRFRCLRSRDLLCSDCSSFLFSLCNLYCCWLCLVHGFFAFQIIFER